MAYCMLIFFSLYSLSLFFFNSIGSLLLGRIMVRKRNVGRNSILEIITVMCFSQQGSSSGRWIWLKGCYVSDDSFGLHLPCYGPLSL